MSEKRDHGGGLDAAVAQFGGTRRDWLDLSTGINPEPYPLGDFSADAWTALPDQKAMDRLLSAARAFWNVPDDAEIVAAPGASALIARLPELCATQTVHIPAPTYNEHAAAFRSRGIANTGVEADAHIYVHPNNPDGRVWSADVIAPRPLTVIDESFCDVMPAASLVAESAKDGVVILKSFGKFWGLAGMRLGFAICAPEMAARIRDLLGPWSVAGPALEIGAHALEDIAWAEATRARLIKDADRLDAMMTIAGAKIAAGTSLFRLYDVDDAAAWQTRLAEAHIWSRVFPYSKTWLRLGLPAQTQWEKLETALCGTAGGAMGASPSVTRRASK